MPELNNLAFFVTDLHGHKDRYDKLIRQIEQEHPSLVFIGGDLMPNFARFTSGEDFFTDFLFPLFEKLKKNLAGSYPEIFIIMGNDDPRIEEVNLQAGEQAGYWKYIHNRKTRFRDIPVYGYACVPPTPFRLKDWERYDVSRYVDPGCIPPVEGARTVDTGEDIEFVTIRDDLEKLCGADDLSQAIFLFHTPPYQTGLDRAGLDGLRVDHVPLDVHVGSVAVKKFIEERQPRITLHGHIHESTRITGHWWEKIGETWAFNGATDQKELALISFQTNQPEKAERRIV